MLATLGGEMQREWEFITAPRADIPTIAELITFRRRTALLRRRALRVCPSRLS